ncbi:MAG TPA: C1 family peptidase [Polyangiaceae bacterium]
MGRVGEVLGGVGIVLLLGACAVEATTGYVPPPQPNGAPRANAPPPPQQVAAAHPTPPPPAAQGHAPPPPPPPPPPPRNYNPPPPPPPAPVSAHFNLRIVHPLPLANKTTGQLDVGALTVMMKQRPARKCGPRQLGGGHWIHLDCNVHQPLATAKPPAALQRHMRLLKAGALKLDSPVKDSPPDSVDHRKDGLEGPIKDQGQVGSCTSFSLSSAMDNAILRQNASDATSSLHIWSHYGYPAMRAAGDGNLNKPIALWAVWPYDERLACEIDQSGGGDCGPYQPPVTEGGAGNDPAVQADIKNADGKGTWRVTEYDSIGNDPDSIAAMLSTGADVWFSMDIGMSWMNPNGDTIADWDGNSIDGGHAVLFAGYRKVNGKRQFLVHNSWGKDWGDNGFAYISEGMVTQFLRDAYKVVVSNGAAPPPPSNPNALTDDDCGADQLVDAVTGQCANMCPDDSRPANGQCTGTGGHAGAKAPPGPPPPPPNKPRH